MGSLGIAFKPDTNDIRLEPVTDVIRQVLAEGAVVQATDPEALQRACAAFPGAYYTGQIHIKLPVEPMRF